MKITIMGINRREVPMPEGPHGILLSYAADKNGGETLTAGRDTGAITIDSWTYEDLAGLTGIDDTVGALFGGDEGPTIQCGGWQSWSAGWELADGENLPRAVRFIPDLLKLTNREGDVAETDKPVVFTDLVMGRHRVSGGKNTWLPGHFIAYLRAGDHYICIASKDGGTLPPVSFRIDRERRLITAEIFCPGKTWKPDDALAEITIFYARGYFNFKDTIGRIFRQEENFKSLDFLRFRPGREDAGKTAGFRNKLNLPGGYESWYNHYTDINEKIILDDLEGLVHSENLIKRWFTDRQRPAVFQIDDGWERAVGEWEVNLKRFPGGLASLAAKIAEAGFIPGLWIAPFLVTRRSRIFAERPGWLLRDKSGHLTIAGYNPLWDKQFFCLDLSRKDVLEYLRGIMDRIIDEWGFRYIKLDFLYAGCFSGVFAEGGAPYEHYERACAVLTARKTTASGLPVAYLGCGCPLGPSYRRLPLSRIGADTRQQWEWRLVKLTGHVGGPGAYVSLMDTIGRSFMDGTVFINDPDVIFLRSRNCKLTEHEKELIALVNFLLGSQIMLSDNTRRQDAADIALTRRILGLYDRLAGDEYGAVRLARNIFRLESRSGRTAGLINLSRRPFTLTADIDAPLCAAFSRGTWLTDHRVRSKGAGFTFAPHTVSIAEQN
ncbi:MAG: alpha-galactosidase [Treponema sp.]|jgi:alpha-galactosidase|nr:alpha-galactosidase [Treponema sp.]